MKRKRYVCIALLHALVFLVSLYLGPITNAGNPEGWSALNFWSTVIVCGFSFVTAVLAASFALHPDSVCDTDS